jgi:hypothetical protein
MTWPKLIGSAVGCVSIGLCIMLSGYFFRPQRYMELAVFVGFCCLSVVSVALLALSHLLWRGRPWALNALIVLCWLLAFSIAVLFSAGMFGGIMPVGDIAVVVGMIITTVSPPLWFAIILRHPDIVRAFSRACHSPDTSKQPLEPTADRRDEQI